MARKIRKLKTVDKNLGTARKIAVTLALFVTVSRKQGQSNLVPVHSMHYMFPYLQAPLLLFVIQVYFLSYRNIVIPSVKVDSLCDRISLVRSVSLEYSAINALHVASFANPSSSVCYPGHHFLRRTFFGRSKVDLVYHSRSPYSSPHTSLTQVHRSFRRSLFGRRKVDLVHQLYQLPQNINNLKSGAGLWGRGVVMTISSVLRVPFI